jgi:hypothetical protein
MPRCDSRWSPAAIGVKATYTPIGLVTAAPMTIIGRSDLPPDTLQELIAYLKSRNTKLTFGNAGIGSASHLCGMLFILTVVTVVFVAGAHGNRAEAITLGTPAGIRAAIEDIDITELAHCRRVWHRHWHVGYGCGRGEVGVVPRRRVIVAPRERVIVGPRRPRR